MTFKEFYYQNAALLESPLRLPAMEQDMLDNAMLNVEEAGVVPEEAVQVDTLKKSDTISFDIWEDEVNNVTRHRWLTKQPFIVCYFLFVERDGELQFKGVWNHRMYAATARYGVFDYYLTNYEFIESDFQHPLQGEKYWKKIIRTACNRGMRVTVRNSKTNEEFPWNQDEELWGDEQKAFLTIRIYRSGQT